MGEEPGEEPTGPQKGRCLRSVLKVFTVQSRQGPQSFPFPRFFDTSRNFILVMYIHESFLKEDVVDNCCSYRWKLARE